MIIIMDHGRQAKKKPGKFVREVRIRERMAG